MIFLKEIKLKVKTWKIQMMVILKLNMKMTN